MGFEKYLTLFLAPPTQIPCVYIYIYIYIYINPYVMVLRLLWLCKNGTPQSTIRIKDIYISTNITIYVLDEPLKMKPYILIGLYDTYIGYSK
jgi:hypothetical protein